MFKYMMIEYYNDGTSKIKGNSKTLEGIEKMVKEYKRNILLYPNHFEQNTTIDIKQISGSLLE